ncbi:hypothetical protein A0257_13995 [Hymenobacter psoromatis]|nr:hypothetical protein A0257_13995 [Hymenobacter psoromatis]
MQTLFEQPGFAILHDTDHCWLYVTWQGKRSGQSSQACCEAILEQVRATQSHKILNDGSLDLDGWGDVVAWIGQDFFDLLADAGVVAVAWVMPRNLRALTDVNKVVTAVTRPAVSTFADTEAACTWLDKSPGLSQNPVAC